MVEVITGVGKKTVIFNHGIIGRFGKRHGFAAALLWLTSSDISFFVIDSSIPLYGGFHQ